MKHSTSRELYEYWDRLRHGRAAPRRNEIEPSDIRHILADTFILEAVTRDSFPIRLAGTRVCGLHCREMKGENFVDLWSDHDRNAIATLATAVSVDGAGAVVSVDALTANERSLTCEILLLPLVHNGPEFDRILGACTPLERPFWIGNDPIIRQSIASLRLIWPDEQPAFLRAGERLTSRDIPLALPQTRRRGHLTVLDGGKE